MPAKGWKLNKETKQWERDPTYNPELDPPAPRKANNSAIIEGFEGAGATGPDEKQLLAGLDQFELPKAAVIRIAKNSVPAGVTLRKEVQMAIVKGATIWVNYLCSIGHEVSVARGQKTITAEHIFAALHELDWDKEDIKRWEKDLRASVNEFKKKRTETKASKSGDTDFISAASPTVAATAPGEQAREEDSPFEDEGEAEEFVFEEEIEGDQEPEPADLLGDNVPLEGLDAEGEMGSQLDKPGHEPMRVD